MTRTEPGAGDQGIVTGYATDETPEYLPLPVVLAHRICRLLDEEPLSGACVDGKAPGDGILQQRNPRSGNGGGRFRAARQGRGSGCAAQGRRDPDHPQGNSCKSSHKGNAPAHQPFRALRQGRSGGGYRTDRRKLAVDQYGPAAHIGGGALSGKDPTKTDRSGAYAARWVAKNLVAAGLAKRCEVQIAYAIGESRPISVTVDAMGTGLVPDAALERAVKEVFDLRPGAIIDALALHRPIYAPLAAYGHFGRPELDLPWERTDRRAALLASVVKQGYPL